MAKSTIDKTTKVNGAQVCAPLRKMGGAQLCAVRAPKLPLMFAAADRYASNRAVTYTTIECDRVWIAASCVWALRTA